MEKPNSITPIILCSLPRSGSTLLQRLLARHREISTVSETWLLLPLMSSLRKGGVVAAYKHSFYLKAQADIWKQLPRGKQDHLKAIRAYALSLYSDLAEPGSRYFLDKTPPYSLVVSEIMEALPDAKFIFLWRNPMAVIASIMQTWAGGRFNLFRTRAELFMGTAGMIGAYEREPHRICAVRYEDICADPDEQLRRIYAYLGLSTSEEKIGRLRDVQLRGELGDDGIMRNSPLVSKDMGEKWKEVLRNPVRRKWCEKYLKWLGPERMAIMGYKQAEVLEELGKLPFSTQFVISDLLRIGYGHVDAVFEFERVLEKTRMLGRGGRVVPYS